MNKYNKIEIQTAKNLIKEGYKWLVRETCGELYAYEDKPHKNYDRDNCDDAWQYDGEYFLFCTTHVPIFQNVTCVDKEPVSLESIVHPQILDDIEREYIKFVLKPFHEEVSYVEKLVDDLIDDGSYSKEYLYVKLHDGEFVFPDFDSGKMYVGMEVDKKYKLDELGITYTEENK